MKKNNLIQNQNSNTSIDKNSKNLDNQKKNEKNMINSLQDFKESVGEASSLSLPKRNSIKNLTLL